MASANTERSTGHSQMVYRGADSASNTLRVGETVSHWTCHQERAHRLSACAEQLSVGGHHVGESIPCISATSVPHYDETSYDDNYQPGFQDQSYYGKHDPGLAHPDITRRCQKYLAVIGTRHLAGLLLLPCPGKRSLAVHDNLLWTRGLSELVRPSVFDSNAKLPR